jgi:hypothetical protein
MFKRRWKWFGKLVSDEGFTLAYQYKGITYTDERGTFEFSLEGGVLIPKPYQIAGVPVTLTQSETDQMVERVVRGIKSEGNVVQVFSK